MEGAPTRRDRLRAATIEEIKQIALRLLRERGEHPKFSDIARELGVTAPALYRYFPDRDALLTALMVDGFGDLRDRLARTATELAATEVTERVKALAAEYRRFAIDDPHRFSLLFGLPAPGFRHRGAPSGHAAQGVLTAFAAGIGDGFAKSRSRHAEASPLTEDLAALLEDGEPSLDVDGYRALWQLIAAIHGFAALEAFGHLDWLRPEARDELFAAQLTTALDALLR